MPAGRDGKVSRRKNKSSSFSWDGLRCGINLAGAHVASVQLPPMCASVSADTQGTVSCCHFLGFCFCGNTRTLARVQPPCSFVVLIFRVNTTSNSCQFTISVRNGKVSYPSPKIFFCSIFTPEGTEPLVRLGSNTVVNMRVCMVSDCDILQCRSLGPDLFFPRERLKKYELHAC